MPITTKRVQWSDVFRVGSLELKVTACDRIILWELSGQGATPGQMEDMAFLVRRIVFRGSIAADDVYRELFPILYGGLSKRRNFGVVYVNHD